MSRSLHTPSPKPEPFFFIRTGGAPVLAVLSGPNAKQGFYSLLKALGAK